MKLCQESLCFCWRTEEQSTHWSSQSDCYCTATVTQTNNNSEKMGLQSHLMNPTSVTEIVRSPFVTGKYYTYYKMRPHLLLLADDSWRAESLPLPLELPTDSLPWESLPCDSFPWDSVPLPLEPLPPISTSSCKGGRDRFLSSWGEPAEAGCSWLLSLPSEAKPSCGSSLTPSRRPQPSL